MPVGAAIGVAGVASAGASVYGSNKASKDAKHATDENAAIQREQNQLARADLQPAVSSGNTARDALMQRLGLTSQPSTAAPAAAPAVAAPTSAKTGIAGTIPAVPDAGSAASAPAPTAAATGGPDYAAYLSANPDVAAYYQKEANDRKGQAEFAKLGITNAADFAKYHYDNFGKNEGRTLPNAQPVAATPVQPAASAPSAIPGQTLTSSDNGGLGARPEISRPNFSEAQPGQVDLSGQAFQASPFYNLGLQDTLRNVNANYGARGLLQSGAGLKGATDAASSNFMQNYGNWANQQLGIWNTNLGQYNANRNVFNQNYNTDTGRTDNLFNSDRAYNTDQYNAYTGNLFNLASQGQAAAAGQANAGQNYAANATANNNSLASVQGNAAIAQANGINNALNSGIQAYGAYASPNPFATAAASTPAVTGGNWLPSGLAF